jgi:hypothetical protein
VFGRDLLEEVAGAIRGAHDPRAVEEARRGVECAIADAGVRVELVHLELTVVAVLLARGGLMPTFRADVEFYSTPHTNSGKVSITDALHQVWCLIILEIFEHLYTVHVRIPESAEDFSYSTVRILIAVMDKYLVHDVIVLVRDFKVVHRFIQRYVLFFCDLYEVLTII